MIFVEDIMTRPVIFIRGSATVENAIWLMRTKQVRALIVKELDVPNYYGILTEQDIVCNVIAKKRTPQFVHIEQIIQNLCISMPIETDLIEAARIFSKTDTYWALVRKNGKAVGIVSMTDILMKGYPGAYSRDDLSRRIDDALRYAYIIDDDEVTIQQECDTAWLVVNEMHTILERRCEQFLEPKQRE